jgi:hypothetical protein
LKKAGDTLLFLFSQKVKIVLSLQQPMLSANGAWRQSQPA